MHLTISRRSLQFGASALIALALILGAEPFAVAQQANLNENSLTDVELATTSTVNETAAFAGPLVDIELSTNGIDADIAPGVGLDVSQPVAWTYVVTNIGGVELFDVAIIDDLEGTVCEAARIRPAGQTSCALQGVASAGEFERVGTVVGASPDGQQVTDTDATHHHANNEVLSSAATPSELSRVVASTTAGSGADPLGLATAGMVILGAGAAGLAVTRWLRRRT